MPISLLLKEKKAQLLFNKIFNSLYNNNLFIYLIEKLLLYSKKPVYQNK
jgi:hypothetical protein